jgi:hypothetical protein
VEVWVLAQSALGIDAGIPAAAKMVCNGVILREPKDIDFTVRLDAALVVACRMRLVTPAYPSIQAILAVCFIICNSIAPAP